MLNKFVQKIKIINGNPYVTPPADILESVFSQANKSTSPIPIKGELNGAKYTQTLVRYQGDWRLYLNGVMLRSAGIDFKDGDIKSVVGKEITITIEFDPSTREISMHPKLKAALDKDPKAKAAFEELAPYRKHEILRYLGFLKTEESIELNIKRILQHLRGEESDALYPLMHRKKSIL